MGERKGDEDEVSLHPAVPGQLSGEGGVEGGGVLAAVHLDGHLVHPHRARHQGADQGGAGCSAGKSRTGKRCEQDQRKGKGR